MNHVSRDCGLILRAVVGDRDCGLILRAVLDDRDCGWSLRCVFQLQQSCTSPRAWIGESPTCHL